MLLSGLWRRRGQQDLQWTGQPNSFPFLSKWRINVKLTPGFSMSKYMSTFLLLIQEHKNIKPVWDWIWDMGRFKLIKHNFSHWILRLYFKFHRSVVSAFLLSTLFLNVCVLFLSLKEDGKLPLTNKCVDAVNRGLIYSYTNLKEYQ